MPEVSVTFVESDGSVYDAKGDEGWSVMQAAVAAGVPGVWADCGGVGTCATCHCYVDPQWENKLDPPEDIEAGMLTAALEPNEFSRLTCQVRLKPNLDGIKFTVPVEQAEV